jgi:hypothetical protein
VFCGSCLSRLSHQSFCNLPLYLSSRCWNAHVSACLFVHLFDLLLVFHLITRPQAIHILPYERAGLKYLRVCFYKTRDNELFCACLLCLLRCIFLGSLPISGWLGTAYVSALLKASRWPLKLVILIYPKLVSFEDIFEHCCSVLNLTIVLNSTGRKTHILGLWESQVHSESQYIGWLLLARAQRKIRPGKESHG